MNTLVKLACITLALFATACSRTDSGSGTGTLFAIAEIAGRPESTRFEVELKQRGAGVERANVVITDDDTGAKTTLIEQSRGLYRATVEGYVRVAALAIESGGDNLEAVLEGPSPHVITRPPDEFRVRRGDFEVLRVEWEADDSADRVLVEAEGIEALSLDGDAEDAEIPLGALKSGEQKISVTRETSVPLDGGTEGSKMTSRYKVDNKFTLEG